MTRHRIKAVTTVPVLIPAGTKEGDGWATFRSELGRPSRVRVFDSSDISPKSLSPLRADQKEHWLAVVELLNALKRKDPLALNKTQMRFQKLHKQDRKGGGQGDNELGQLLSQVFRVQPQEAINWFHDSNLTAYAKKNPRWLLSSEISHALRDVRFVLWWTDEKFLPGLYCPDGASALYVHTLLTFVRGKGFAVCPHCGGPFVQQRSNQDYCSIAHREAHRVARWRQSKRGK